MSDPRSRRFSQLLEPHFDGLYRTALRLTRNRQDAEDLVQDACLRAYAKLEDFERADRSSAWLQRVQYRLFVDAARHRNRSPFAALPDPAALIELTVSEIPGPDEILEGDMLQQRLDRAWPRLAADQRALLALHAEGYSLAELERITGISSNAIGVRLHRARSRLRKLLKCAIGRAASPLQLEKCE